MQGGRPAGPQASSTALDTPPRTAVVQVEGKNEFEKEAKLKLVERKFEFEAWIE
jgi:hypothetical protein